MKFFFNRQQKEQDTPLETETAIAADDSNEIESEITAVIAIAIHKYVYEVREYENTVVTIQQVIKPYSPWSSKIYGLRQQPMYMPGLRSRIK